MRPPEAAPTPPERPWLFGFLIMPQSMLTTGIVSGCLALLLRQQGVSLDRSAGIVSLLTLPQTIFFLWSPVTDFLVRRRTWLMLSSIAAGIMCAIAFQRRDLASHTAVALLFLSVCLAQLSVASCGGMMGTLTESGRRLSGSFYQAGGLAAGAIAVFFGAAYGTTVTPRTLGLVSGTAIALPSLLAFAFAEQRSPSTGGFTHSLSLIGPEFRRTFLNWRAVPYILVLTFPIGSGALIGLLPALAADYHVSNAQVAWMNGLGGAFLSIFGALAVTLIPTRIRASVATLTATAINAIPLFYLCLAPQTPATYFIGATVYLFTIGSCWALVTSVVLEFLGHSGRSGCSRYAIINSITNLPPVYMAYLDGRGYAHWGPRGLPATEAVLTLAGSVILLAWFLTHAPQPASDLDTGLIQPQHS